MQLNPAKFKSSNKVQLDIRPRPARISLISQEYINEYPNILIEKLIPFKNQARFFFDEESLKELAESIKEHGLRQPLTVILSPDKEGFYEVVSGERRLRAAKMVGLEKLPCIMLNSLEKAEEIALIENLQREDLHPLEEMEAYASFIEKGICVTHQEIAEKLKIQRSKVVETLLLKNIGQEAREYILKNNIKARALFRELVKLTPEQQIEHLKNKKENVEQPSEVKIKKERGLKRKSNILQIVMDRGKLEVQKYNLDKLDKDEKEKMRELLFSLAER